MAIAQEALGNLRVIDRPPAGKVIIFPSPNALHFGDDIYKQNYVTSEDAEAIKDRVWLPQRRLLVVNYRGGIKVEEAETGYDLPNLRRAQELGIKPQTAIFGLALNRRRDTLYAIHLGHHRAGVSRGLYVPAGELLREGALPEYYQGIVKHYVRYHQDHPTAFNGTNTSYAFSRSH